MVRCDTDKHLLNVGIFFIDIMHIIRCDKRNARISAESLNSVEYNLFLLYAVILKFQKVIALTENRLIPKSGTLCALVITSQEKLRYFTCKAGGEANEPIAVFFEQVTVDSRLKIKALGIRQRHHFYQIFISRLIFDEKNKVVIL